MTPPARAAAARNIAVIGTSAGGVRALQAVVAGLPRDYAGSVFVVLHLWAAAKSYLPVLLSNAGPLTAVHPEDGIHYEPGRIYVAPPDHHMTLEDGVVRITRGPRENMHRPSIDVLFRSAANCCGPQTVGVLLTGLGDDGSAGLKAIEAHGGITIIQSPDEAPYPQMPMSAMRAIAPDYRVTVAEIGPILRRLSRERAANRSAPAEHSNPGPGQA